MYVPLLPVRLATSRIHPRKFLHTLLLRHLSFVGQTRFSNRFRQRHAEIQLVHDNFDNRRNDPVTRRSPDRHDRVAVFRHDGW